MYVDREEIQTRRLKRLKGLKRSVEQAINEFQNGNGDVQSLSVQVNQWLAEPFQADVADYFFRGPGKTEKPFCDLIALGVTISMP